MPEKTVRGIPIIGRQGLMAIFGAIVGVLFDRWIAGLALSGYPQLATPVYGALHVDDVVSMAVPLVLLVVLKRFRAFFLGWFIGAFVCELTEWVTQFP